MYHLTTSCTIPYLYITQLFQSALFLISTSPGHTSVSPYYQQYHSISVHHSVLPINPLSHLHITRPYQCITLLPAVQFCICTSLSSFSPLSHLNFTRPYQCITLLPAVPFRICTSLSPSNQPSFTISTSPGHTSVSPYYQQYHSISVHHSALSAIFLVSTSPGHTSVSSYYQQYHSISVHHSALPISPLSHLHFTRPYQCITLLPAVPFRICTSLSSSNQPSFSSPLHQAIPVYHLTTSSTIPYLYITQSFQSALFLISTSPGHTSVSPYYQQYHSISVHHSVLPISPLSHLHITRPYQCITLLPAVPFCICTSLSSSNQPSFSSPLHQAIPVYHLTTSSTILYLYITQLFQPSFSSKLHQAIPVYHLTTSSTIPYLYITQLFQSALFLISTSPGHTSVSPYYQQYHSISVHHSALPISPLSHLHFTRPYQCITLLPAVPFHICTSLSPSNQPSFSSPHHQAIPVYHLITSSTIPYLYITQSFQSALFHHLHITRPYQCITLLPAVPFCICTSLRSSNQPSFPSPHHQAIPVYHLTTSSTILYLHITQFFQASFSSKLHQAIPVYHLTTSSTIPYLYITQSFQSTLFLISTSPGHTSVSPYYQQYNSVSVHHSDLSHLNFTRPYQCITLLPAVPFRICTSLSPSNQPSFTISTSPGHTSV